MRCCPVRPSQGCGTPEVLQLTLTDLSFTFELWHEYTRRKVFAQSNRRYSACCFSEVLLWMFEHSSYHRYTIHIVDWSRYICFFEVFCSWQKSGRRAVFKVLYFVWGQVCWLTLLPAVPFLTAFFISGFYFSSPSCNSRPLCYRAT